MTMARINMDGSDDPFYRYTMPALAVKVEDPGGKMIKTVLPNIEDVAKAVGRPHECALTWLHWYCRWTECCCSSCHLLWTGAELRKQD